MATKKVYAGLTVALATSLGINATLLGVVPLKAAIPVNHCISLRSELAPAQKTAVESFAVSNLADEALANFGAGVVSLADVKVKGICIAWRMDEGVEKTYITARDICKPGEWTEGQ